MYNTIYCMFHNKCTKQDLMCFSQIIAKHSLQCIIRSLDVCHAIYLDVFRLIFVYPFYFFLLHLILVPKSLLSILIKYLFGKRQYVYYFKHYVIIEKNLLSNMICTFHMPPSYIFTRDTQRKKIQTKKTIGFDGPPNYEHIGVILLDAQI